MNTKSEQPSLILPDWSAPSTVGAFVTTRETGPSEGDFASFNPAAHVGDDPAKVNLCRRLLEDQLDDSRPLLWLDQVHGTSVQRSFEPSPPKADAAVAMNHDYACVVMTADCLPVFFCDRRGTKVGVAHAGWRGLAEGVLEATLDALGCEPANMLAWLGPAISNAQFEVGREVFDTFVAHQAEAEMAFEPSPYKLNHYMADLYRLARLRLEALGLTEITGGHFCTASDPRFYSYRRDDGHTGRMASVIWLR
ncbi:peptidoglycan editing factor PgeF [Phytohalomonas tamaricis]|uniref:peptidoglycan editing factor PgeF n=1 Tax=Phytohalomonas tamaricis TaxID=2081032 RepID=UPI000D0B1AB6|nr:peptidoglycan editing factor PgeF [Phytohalomonas tamaricis]